VTGHFHFKWHLWMLLQQQKISSICHMWLWGSTWIKTWSFGNPLYETERL
jgi:hypothetical protein